MKVIIPLLLALSVARPHPTAFNAEDELLFAEGTTVTGTVVNLTTGEPAPEGLEVMLHGWGPDGEQLEMLHGVLGRDGAFAFEGVELKPDAAYAAMVTYQDVTYFSPHGRLTEDGVLGPIEISIYETTASLDQVFIDQHHILLGFAQGGLSVSEIYAITNEGDRTVREAIPGDENRQGTLRFPLPVGAANVSFPMAPGDRFTPMAEGFLDTHPLIPGERSGQVIVSYVLTYEDELILDWTAPYGTEKISVLLPHGSGLSLDVPRAEYLGVETLADGSAVEAYSLGRAAAGDQIEMAISGRPEAQITGLGSEAPPRTGTGDSLAIGVAALGAALIGAGIWWFRREGSAADWDDEGSEHEEVREATAS